MLERDPRNIFYYQRDVENYTNQIFDFLLFDQHEYTYSIFCSVILVSIFMLRVIQLLRCSSIFDWQKQFLFSENSFLEKLASYWLLTFYLQSLVRWKKAVFIGNHGGKLMSYYLHSFKEYQSILETRQISHLYGSALFTSLFLFTLLCGALKNFKGLYKTFWGITKNYESQFSF